MLLLQPITIGNLRLKNRFIMAAMGPELGNFDRRTVDYYLRRAQGGASMILTNVIATEAFDGHGPSSTLTEDSFEGFRSLVKEAHLHDCKICIQIMPGVGLGGKAPDRAKPASVSATPLYPGSDILFDELTREEIKFIQGEVFKTVALAKKAGADAVELHAYGGYLTDKFMSSRWNLRTDEYGGSFENRMRFLNELIEGIQTTLGTAFPLIVKYTPSHFLPPEHGYRAMEEGIEIAKMLEQKGVHALHVDAGCHDNWYMAMPPIYQQEAVPQLLAARTIKAHTSLPVFTNGRLGDISKAEAALQNGWIDMVGVARALLADPDFPNKLAENRTDEIRSCIYCNEGCIKSVTEGEGIKCAVNPLAGFESLKMLPKTNVSKKILVIGAGPGGCQAAISAAEAGHDVEIWEKSARLGGNFYNACLPSFKRDGEKLLQYYSVELKNKGVRIKYCKEANAAEVRSYAPDSVIYAAGAVPVKPRSIPGIDKAHVAAATEVLQNHMYMGARAAVIGAGLVGCETALVLANSGKHVTIVEMADKILPEPVFIQNAMMLHQMLQHPNITIKNSCKLMSIEDEGIVVETSGEKETLACDNVVLAMGFRPNVQLYDELKDELQITNVGDSVQVRKVLDAVHEAYDAVLAI
ncbi:NAD(P)/FAD-dependent oxidoreductase [Paenibacillus polymyxa]|uniref:NAD(P)/FAD-dependent oxidoreductase n=1 Tax=Paenibacillus polymyxa TaxID=1406 RepID=UPI002AB4FDEA|nr:NAD(P)/FAD-dependent oxidoreductase [Paenibacillus polymyxa]MDY8024641.1 NAD(P)/FAD-dependent oxidoreductase [Paenibacillus polymyxa]